MYTRDSSERQDVVLCVCVCVCVSGGGCWCVCVCVLLVCVLCWLFCKVFLWPWLGFGGRLWSISRGRCQRV